MIDFLKLRKALESSWDDQTSYLAVKQSGNPSFGQCYPTSWLVKQYFPAMKIVKGKVWNGHDEEGHFWNIIEVDGVEYSIDLTWQQFPAGSYVKSYKVLSGNELFTTPEAVKRCSILKKRVDNILKI